MPSLLRIYGTLIAVCIPACLLPVWLLASRPGAEHLQPVLLTLLLVLLSLLPASVLLLRRFRRAAAGQAKELVVARRRLAAVGSGLAEGVLILGQDRRLLYLNQAAAKLFQVGLESAVGSLLQQVVPVKEVGQVVETVFSQETSMSLAVKYQTRWLELSLSCIRDGARRNLVLVFADVTDARQLEKVRYDFIANVSHELKTPITAILGLVDTVLDDEDMKSKTRKNFLERIRRQTVRMSTLVTELLLLSRLDAMDRISDSSPVCLNRLLQQVYDSLQENADDLGLELNLELPEQDILVDGDSSTLDQLMVNLLDNAFKYSESGDRVTLRLFRLGQMVAIQVQDTGIGIRDKQQQRIFERFYRVNDTRHKAPLGTGLGLAIVKHVARLHGGDATVESSFGAGSTFTVRLPLKIGAPPPGRASTTEKASPVETTPPANPAQTQTQLREQTRTATASGARIA